MKKMKIMEMKYIILKLDLIYISYFMFNFPNINNWLTMLVILINFPYLILLSKNNSNDNQ